MVRRIEDSNRKEGRGKLERGGEERSETDRRRGKTVKRERKGG